MKIKDSIKLSRLFASIVIRTTSAMSDCELPSGFVHLRDVDATILQSVRYAGSNNFIGRPIAGYEAPTVILSEQAATALSAAQKNLYNSTDGALTLVVFDGYRPQTAVDDFIKWSEDFDDMKMKDSYYPNIPDKSQLFELGYIAKRSGHSRGSTVDLSIAHCKSSTETSIAYMDMGSEFDVLDQVSHFNCTTIDDSARANRKLLRDLMEAHGFAPYDEEWWHFSLKDEPFPDTYFSFPVR